MYDQKLTNPKDVIGSSKLPLHLVPVSAVSYMAMAALEGAMKYGAHNWKICGVRVSIYFAATLRHLWKFWLGEWADPKTKVPHLASAMMCIAIILDARLLKKLTDDRPPATPGGIDLIDAEGADVTKHLKEMFKNEHPHHYSIGETEIHEADEVNGPQGVSPDGSYTQTCKCGEYTFFRKQGDLEPNINIPQTQMQHSTTGCGPMGRKA